MAAFQDAQDALTAASIELIVASTDDVDGAEKMSAHLRERGPVDFPIGYGLPLHEVASRFGAFYEDRRGILHATGFLIRPGRNTATSPPGVAVSVYSSSAIGRLEPPDVLSLAQYWDSRD